MKHSKVYLGVTTCLLAIIGVAATKAHKFTTMKAGYFGTHGGTAPTCCRLSHNWFTNGVDGALTLFRSKSFDVYTACHREEECSGNRLWQTALD